MLATSDPTLLGVAAIITAIAGIITSAFGAIKAHREGKQQADDELRQKLRECRIEAESLANELHQIKMDRLGS